MQFQAQLAPQIGHPYKLFYNSKVLKKWRALCRILGVIGLGGELRRKQTRKGDASLRLGMRQISQSASGHWLLASPTLGNFSQSRQSVCQILAIIVNHHIPRFFSQHTFYLQLLQLFYFSLIFFFQKMSKSKQKKVDLSSNFFQQKYYR